MNRSSRPPRRYSLARWIHLAVSLYLSLAGWSRLALAVRDQDLLTEFGIRPGALYLQASGAAWGLMGLAAAALLFVPRPWARLTVFAVSLVFALTFWLDRLFLVRAPDAQANWPFALALTLVLLLFSAALMYLLTQQEQHDER